VSATYTTTIVFSLVSGLSVKNPFVCGAFHWFVDFYPATEHRHNMADPGPLAKILEFLQNATIGNDCPSLTVESVKDLRELWRKFLEPFR
jgi:hypothetical protein